MAEAPTSSNQLAGSGTLAGKLAEDPDPAEGSIVVALPIHTLLTV